MLTLRTVGRSIRRAYRRLVQRQTDDRTREILDVLAQMPAFDGCAQSTLRAIANVMHRRTYRRDEPIYFENDPGLGLYVIQQGHVALLSSGNDADTTVELGQLGPGQVFGTLSIFGDFRRMETARAVTKTFVYGFFRPDLKNLTKRNPQAGAEVAMDLARHLAGQHVALVDAMAAQIGRPAALKAFSDAAVQLDLSDGEAVW